MVTIQEPTVADWCICDLLEVSTLGEVRYVRGYSNGCPVHPATQYELEQQAERVRREAEREAVHDAARRAAREAP